jgi:hypothetical protein
MKTQDKKNKIVVKKKKSNAALEIPRTLRTEFNFLKYPFFDLSKESDRSKIKIEEWVETKDGKLRILWLVTKNVESKFPGDFEKRLHRAIEQIINSTPKPIENPLRLGSLRYIAALMGISADSGKNREDIKQAFKNIVKTTIESEGTYQVKETSGKRNVSDTFHLYDRVVFTGEDLPSGKKADSVYLFLGSWYLRNINNNYVVPLDWRFYNQLKGSITTRMYEFLSIYFFSSLEKNRDFYDLKYFQICDFFPLARQDQKWKARKQLKNAHDSLIEQEYLDKIEWLDINQNDNWVIRYWVGKRAREEYEKNKSEKSSFVFEEIRPIALPGRRRTKGTTNAEGSQESSPDLEVLQLLIQRGVTQKAAENLIDKHPKDRICEKVEIFDYLFSQKSNLLSKNPPGWLVSAIESDYAPPADFEPKSKKLEREAARIDSGKKLEERFKREEYRQWIETPAENKVWWDLEKWKKEFQESSGIQPTPEAVDEKRKELITLLPTNAERQVQIFGEVIYPESGDLFE